MARARLIAFLVLLTLASGPWAQAQDPRARFGGILGGGRTWDDEGSIGTGAALGGRIDWRLFGRTRIEGAVDLLTHRRRSGFFQAEGRSVIFSASLLQGLSDSAAQPYLLGGLSLVRHSNTLNQTSTTGHGFHFGGGVSFRVGERFDAGPETRFYIIDPETSSDPAWAYWIGGRFSVRF
jgi:hypothetical protein